MTWYVIFIHRFTGRAGVAVIKFIITHHELKGKFYFSFIWYGDPKSFALGHKYKPAVLHRECVT